MINKDECQQIGYITKTHNVDGEVSLTYTTETIFDIFDKGQIFIEFDGYLVPFFIEYYKQKNKKNLIVKFIDTDSLTNAKQLVNKNVFTNIVINTENRTETLDNSFIGFTIKDITSKNTGTVIDFIDFSGNKNFVIACNNNEFIIPANKDFINNVDYNNKIIVMNLPEGLFELT